MKKIDWPDLLLLMAAAYLCGKSEINAKGEGFALVPQMLYGEQDDKCESWWLNRAADVQMTSKSSTPLWYAAQSSGAAPNSLHTVLDWIRNERKYSSGFPYSSAISSSSTKSMVRSPDDSILETND